MSASILGVGWREEAWERLGELWDLVVVGGGISGAGIARRASRLGLRTLLVEQRDLAWGTSSRSSKLVHGGLRYLAHGQIGVVRDSVRERERLLRAAPGLVEEVGFLIPTYRGVKPGRLTYAAGLAAYDLLARRRTHRHLGRTAFELEAPRIRTEGLTGGFRYGDARADDARLTLRVAQDALAAGATVLTYVRAEEVMRADGRVVGVKISDVGTGRTCDVRATAVANVTGAWADRLRAGVGAPPRIRPLRGSHLVFAAHRLPVYQTVSFPHPADGRPVFAVPWEGVTIVGTTDVDHAGDLDAEPRIAPEETAYLADAVAAAFPSLAIRAEDAIASYAGVRPVIGSGKADPSAESRDHAVWDEDGLLTVTGGKLTTFDAIARDALDALRPRFAGRIPRGVDAADPPLDAVAPEAVPPGAAADLAPDVLHRLAGRYGRLTSDMLRAAGDGELEPIPGSIETWAALRWAARSEGVVHLDDLLLRRVRLGLLLPDGAAAVLPRIRAIAQPELGWGDERWVAEEAAYLELWAANWAPPGWEAPAWLRERGAREAPAPAERTPAPTARRRTRHPRSNGESGVTG
jgi:glycerol-3-phosphate dehydrogenase